MNSAAAGPAIAASILLIGWAAAAAPDKAADAAPLVAGARAYQKCYSCHALEPGRNDLSGPTLYAIVGREIASEDGFAYSPALRRFAEQRRSWNEELLDRFIADPEVLVPGTAMTFHGIAKVQEREQLILYLKHAARP